MRGIISAHLVITLVMACSFGLSEAQAQPIDSWDRERAGSSVSGAKPGESRYEIGHDGRLRRRSLVLKTRRTKPNLETLKVHDYGEKVVLGFFTGARIYDANAQVGNGPEDVNLDSGVALGIRTGYNLTRYISIRAEGLYAPSKYYDDGGTAHVLGIRGYMSLHLPWKNWRTFLLVGGGVEILPTDVDDVEVDYDGAFIAGLGGKYDVNDSMSVRLDVRAISTDGKINGAINWEALLGLSFRFMVE